MNTSNGNYSNYHSGHTPLPPQYGANPYAQAGHYYPLPQSLFSNGFTPLNSMLAADQQNAHTQNVDHGASHPQQELHMLLQPLPGNIDTLLLSQQAVARDIQQLHQIVVELKQTCLDGLRQLRDDNTTQHAQSRQRLEDLDNRFSAFGHQLQPEPSPQEHENRPAPEAPVRPPPLLSKAVTQASHNKLWVGGFFAHMQLRRLHNEFSKYGDIGSLIRGGKGWAVITCVSADAAAQAQRAMHGRWAKPGRRPGIKVTPWTSARLPAGEDYIQSPEHKKHLGRAQPHDRNGPHPTLHPSGAPATTDGPKQPGPRAPTNSPPDTSAHEHGAASDELHRRRSGDETRRRATVPRTAPAAPGGSHGQRPGACASQSHCSQQRPPTKRGGARQTAAATVGGAGESHHGIGGAATVVADAPEGARAAPHGGGLDGGGHGSGRDIDGNVGTARGEVGGSEEACAPQPARQDGPSNGHSSPTPRDNPPSEDFDRQSSNSPIDAPPGSRPRGCPRLPGTYGADSPQAPTPDQDLRQTILRDYTLTEGGIYVQRTAAWQRYHDKEQTGWQTVDLPGVGNCFYEGFVLHEQLPNPDQFQTFRDVKDYIRDFARRPDTRESLLSGSYRRLPYFADFNQAAYTAIMRHLSKDGDHATEKPIQLAALALAVNIHIHDIQTPGADPLQIQGSSSHEEAQHLNTIHLLVRQDQHHQNYTHDFKPLNKADGHFWKIIGIPSPAAGNDKGSVVTRPEKLCHQ